MIDYGVQNDEVIAWVLAEGMTKDIS